ncbi:MAG: hypothetical protein US39_C0001G0193 [Microgenomates group bacterium GW2011_GWC1_37_12b]|nr:MAG: hypothetical protein US39_C0001G0193 [Microgenomates group bacterium GW2011_GWC1_37_12b]
MNNTIEKRQINKRGALLQELLKTPVVQIACQKVGIGRATYYRWRKENQVFANEADSALEEGSSFINDIAESQLLSAIKDQNMTAIIFWLKHHHKTYTTRVEISSPNTQIDALKPDQEKLVRKALELASLIPGEVKENENEST